MIAMAGARRVAVPLVRDGRGFALDIDAVRAAITPRTRAIIVNSPHNPTGMVLTDDELSALAAVAVETDLLVISDEVYERLTFDGREHRPIATYPGMAERTVTISSAAKMFNCTGWKIGWTCGASKLVEGVRTAKQYMSYVAGAPFQPAVAYALNNEDVWVDSLRDSLQAKRDRLALALTDLGFELHDSAGTYFLCADPRPLDSATAPRSARSCPTGSGSRRSRCRRSATLVGHLRSGITSYGSRSASGTKPSTRRSAGWQACAEIDFCPVSLAQSGPFVGLGEKDVSPS